MNFLPDICSNYLFEEIDVARSVTDNHNVPTCMICTKYVDSLSELSYFFEINWNRKNELYSCVLQLSNMLRKFTTLQLQCKLYLAELTFNCEKSIAIYIELTTYKISDNILSFNLIKSIFGENNLNTNSHSQHNAIKNYLECTGSRHIFSNSYDRCKSNEISR